MPKYFRDDVDALFISQDTARHRTADEFPIVHKKIPHAEANVIRKHDSLVDWQGLNTLSSTLGRSPPVQRGEENTLAGDIQSITAG